MSEKESAEAVRPPALSLYCADRPKSAQKQTAILFARNQHAVCQKSACCFLGGSFGVFSEFACGVRPARYEAGKRLGFFKTVLSLTSLSAVLGSSALGCRRVQAAARESSDKFGFPLAFLRPAGSKRHPDGMPSGSALDFRPENRYLTIEKEASWQTSYQK